MRQIVPLHHSMHVQLQNNQSNRSKAVTCVRRSGRVNCRRDSPEDRQREVKRGVKIVVLPTNNRYLEGEISIHTSLNHPLIVGFEGCIPATSGHKTAMVMGFCNEWIID
jgi:hypothetical protein